MRSCIASLFFKYVNLIHRKINAFKGELAYILGDLGSSLINIRESESKGKIL